VGITVKPDGALLWRCFRCERGGKLGGELGGTEPSRPSNAIEPLRCKRRIGDGLSDYFAALWRDSRPITARCIAGQYLLARCCVLPPDGSHVRWHPNVKHSPSKRSGPALVSLVTCAATNAPMSVHRTWIRSDGAKCMDPPRMAAAGHPVSGGVIRIWPDAFVQDSLAVAEGIETGLSVARIRTPVWAAIDAGNLAKLPPVQGIESLFVYADRDDHRKGERAAWRAARRWIEAGREARVFVPDRAGDFNDLARELGR
jgi:hypothetical protein